MNNLKKLAITACTALLISAGSVTLLHAEGNKNEYLASLVRLETFMNNTEHSVMYTVPAIHGTDEVSAEMERLEMLAALTEASLKYTAPVVEDHDENNTESVKEIMLAEKTK